MRVGVQGVKKGSKRGGTPLQKGSKRGQKGGVPPPKGDIPPKGALPARPLNEVFYPLLAPFRPYYPLNELKMTLLPLIWPILAPVWPILTLFWAYIPVFVGLIGKIELIAITDPFNSLGGRRLVGKYDYE